MRHLPSTLGSKKGAAFSFSLLGGKFSAFYSNICRFGLDPNPAPYSGTSEEWREGSSSWDIHPSKIDSFWGDRPCAYSPPRSLGTWTRALDSAEIATMNNSCNRWGLIPSVWIVHHQFPMKLPLSGPPRYACCEIINDQGKLGHLSTVWVDVPKSKP